jgi:DNA-binding Lrp family transcriptional regulator
MTKLDKKNKKILEILDKNCRVSLKGLSRAIKISKQATLARIKQLEKEVIRGYTMIIDSFKLGYKRLELFIKIQGILQRDLKDKLSPLKKESNITWIANFLGDFDVALTLYYKSNAELATSLSKVYKILGPYIQRKELHFTKKKVTQSISFSKENVRKIIDIKDNHKFTFKLSKNEKKLLGLLKHNGRATYTELAKKLGATPKTVKNILKKLEKEKVILGYKPLIDYNALGFIWNICLIESVPGTNINPILELLKNEKRVPYFSISIENNILFDFLSDDYISFRNFANSLKNQYNQIIKNYMVLNLDSTTKF